MNAHISPKETFDWSPEGTIEAICPACGESGPKPKFLEAPSLPRKGETVTLVHCPSCRSRFIADLEPAEYGKEETSEFPLRFYVEQGAGIVDPQRRAAIYGEVQKRVMDQALWFPVHNQVQTVAWRTNRTGYRFARAQWMIRFYEVV